MSDFTEETDVSGTFEEYTDDTGVDFVDIGDEGIIIVSGYGYGEGGYGEGPYGGGTTIIVSGSTTEWTDIDTP